MLSNKIKELRKEKGYTFAKLSELSGISTKRLSDLASGKRNNPTMDALIKLADALGASLDELVGRDGK
jgi:transcriptional regulator with XRE-family HTH domain